MRSLTERSSASEIRVTSQRFGRNRRLVLRFEWLTLWPVCAVLPVRSHRRDMSITSIARSTLAHPREAVILGEESARSYSRQAGTRQAGPGAPPRLGSQVNGHFGGFL